jgi:uncharacterized surface protein with fasciclin (FAS1) repeats
MTFTRLLTTAAAASLLAGLAPLAVEAQTPKTEAAAAAATGKASTDAPAATAVQGTAKAVTQAGINAQATAAAPAGKLVASGDMASTLRQAPDFTTFVKALDATNLASLIQSRPNMTVFAPTNAAFAALPPGKLDALMADKQGLQKLLLHHIINAPMPASKIKGSRGPIPSGAGDAIVIDGSGEPLKADNANIVQADVVASNGTIHVVDQVLIAGSVPATLPEPAAEPTPEAAAPATPAKPAAKKK